MLLLILRIGERPVRRLAACSPDFRKRDHFGNFNMQAVSRNDGRKYCSGRLCTSFLAVTHTKSVARKLGGAQQRA